MVWAPLGTRPVQGLVFRLAADPQVEAVKDIIAPIEPSPLVAPIGLELADWISRYYMSSLFDAASLMLPPGFRTRVRSHLRDARRNRGTPFNLDARQASAMDLVAGRTAVGEREFLSRLGKGAEQELRWLLKRGLVERRWRLPGAKMSHHYDYFVRPAAVEEAEEVAALTGSRASRQLALYQALTYSEERIPASLANKEYGSGAVAGLLRRGLASLEWVRTEREPPIQREGPESRAAEIVLTPPQERALTEITSALERPGGVGGPFLIHGVTGSGKTEVYLRALERCVAMGKKGIYLVPEISMTPQTVHRLNLRFSGRVAVLHSGLTTGQQFDNWWKIRSGEFDVVVGPRSALFAPVADLGLVVLDEEHEWTYKQQEASPRYHARAVALKLCELSGAILVMGSATPDVETYYRAKHGGNTLLELPRRIAPAGGGGTGDGAGLARVEVCDMRRELREGNRSIFSRRLAEALDECIRRREQAVLFLNRRGSSTLVQCRDCGHAVQCRSCAVTLTYHASDSRLVCHHCNRRSTMPRGCPECRSPRIRYLGVGSQRVVDELRTLSPGVTALRWDRDTAIDPRAHESIMGRFLRGEAQVLIGTQMVAKGLDVPRVTLVGAVLADVGLNLPDFRAGERAFQLLCQVAGRAGRGVFPGRVVVQTYTPTHYAIQAAAGQNYPLLYGKEIRYRHEHGNPPFSQLIHMVYVHTNSNTCQRETERMGRRLRHSADSLGLTDVQVIGPAPAFPQRVRGRFRWHLILRGRNLHASLEGMAVPQGWTLDVDPVSVL